MTLSACPPFIPILLLIPFELNNFMSVDGFSLPPGTSNMVLKDIYHLDSPPVDTVLACLHIFASMPSKYIDADKPERSNCASLSSFLFGSANDKHCNYLHISQVRELDRKWRAKYIYWNTIWSPPPLRFLVIWFTVLRIFTVPPLF